MTVNLKAWRQSAGITQAQAADKIAVTLRHYQRLESGQSPINRRLALILESLGAFGHMTID